MTKLSPKVLAMNGEDLAVEYLQQHKYGIIARNFHSAFGELDVVATDSEELVFIEVKTRSSSNLSQAEASITISKRKKLTKTALCFLEANPEYANWSCRFDVLIILYRASDSTYQIHHFKNHFFPEYD
jgi:putative endonuclease